MVNIVCNLLSLVNAVNTVNTLFSLVRIETSSMVAAMNKRRKVDYS